MLRQRIPLQTPNPVSRADKLGLQVLTPAPVAVGCPGPGQAGQDRAPEERSGCFQREGGQDWSGAVTGPANPTGVLGRGGGRWDGCPGAGRFPDQNWCPSPKASPQVGMWRGRGAERVPSLLTSRAWGERSCRKSRAAGGSGGGAQPLLGPATPLGSVLAHSKVSHCFLSCSTEPGAGAGLTSCLVFHSKSSKGSLAA